MSVYNTVHELHTYNFRYNCLDSPGQFLKTMIRAASQADIAILIVDATNFDSLQLNKGQTYQHLLICHAFGIRQIIVCINKMDHESIKYDQDIFNKIKTYLQQMLSDIGYSNITDKQDVTCTFIPTSAFKGDNLFQRSINMKWYNGYNVGEALDTFIKPIDRYSSDILSTMYVYDYFRIMGVGDVIVGKINQGKFKPGDIVRVLPSKSWGKCFSLEQHHLCTSVANCGQCIGMNIKGFRKEQEPNPGELVIIDDGKEDNQSVVTISKHFVAEMKIINHPKNKIKIGYEMNMHIVTNRLQCKILSIHSKRNKDCGDDQQIEYPKDLESGDVAQIMFKVIYKDIVLTPFNEKYNPILRKIIGLDKNEVIMYGKISDDCLAELNQLLVYGYIRFDIQKCFKLHIAKDIKHEISKFVYLN